MRTGQREEMAKEATKKVLNTLSWADYVSVCRHKICEFGYSTNLADALCWSAKCLNWSIVTRAHVPRQ